MRVSSRNFFRAVGKNFRELRATPPFAAKPLGSGFSLFAASFGAHHYRNAANSPSSATPPVRRKVQKQKAWFLLLREIIVFTKKVLKETKLFSVIFRDNRRARPLCRLTAVFLSAARQNNARLAAVCFILNRKRCGIVLPLSQKSRSASARCDFREPC